MADEPGMSGEEQEDDGGLEGATAETVMVLELPPPDINPRGYSKWPGDRFVQAAYDGNLELLEQMLDRENPVDGFHDDFDAHCERMTALQAASVNGQLEAVERLLAARCDPHVKTSQAYGHDPKDGETARDLADKMGWDDITEILKKAEAATPKGLYKKYGKNNNAKLWPIHQPRGLNPEQERRAKMKHKGVLSRMPNKAERKFYGEMVFGVTFGCDEEGNVIKVRDAAVLAPSPAGGLVRGIDVGVGGMLALEGAGGSGVALLFPGYGSQYPGMMQGQNQKQQIKTWLDKAAEVLGYDLYEVCVNGKESELEAVDVSTVALYVANLVAAERLREQRPEAVQQPRAVCGLNLGTFSALSIAGVMSYEVGLEVVKALADAMAECSRTTPQGMVSVAGLAAESLEELCKEVKKRTQETCEFSNLLFPKGYTLGGTTRAVAELRRLVESAGAKQVRQLKIASALNTSLMEPARVKLEQVLTRLLPKLKPPVCDVYLNLTGKAVPAGTDPEELIPLLCESLVKPALWEESIKAMVQAGLKEFYEVGPMRQLKAVMKRIDAIAWANTQNMEV